MASLHELTDEEKVMLQEEVRYAREVAAEQNLREVDDRLLKLLGVTPPPRVRDGRLVNRTEKEKL